MLYYAKRLSFTALVVVCLAALPLLSATYVPVAEWNGTHCHPLNATGQYDQQMITEPVTDVTFNNSNSVVVWNDGTLDYAYVVDSWNDRVRVYETSIAYFRDAALVADFPAGANAVTEFDEDAIFLTNGGVVRGSESITIDGVAYTRTASLTGKVIADRTYTIVYAGVAATGGVLTFVTGTMVATSVPIVEYAFRLAADAATEAEGDIDQQIAAAAVNGITTADFIEINETFPNDGTPNFDFENLSSIAFNLNTDGVADVADIYLLDAGDYGTLESVLHTFQIENDAAVIFDFIDTYNGPLNATMDVDIEQSAVNVLAIPLIVDWTGQTVEPAAPPTATILNNAMVQNHDYTVAVIGTAPAGPSADLDGAFWQVTDETVGNVIKIQAIGTTIVGNTNFDNLIPGIRYTFVGDASIDFSPLAGTGAGVNTTGGTPASNNDFIFIADTGNDRIVVLRGGDNGATATNGSDQSIFGDGATVRDDYEVVTAGH